MKKWSRRAAFALLAVVLILAGCVGWAEHKARQRIAAASLAGSMPAPAPRPAPNPLRNAYFGETHLHTSLSMDAGVLGAENTPRTAFRFAQGEEVALADGQKQKLAVPLDFAAVTDHAEGMGVYAQCSNRNSATYWSLNCMGVRYQLTLMFPRLTAMVRQIGSRTGQYDESMCGAGGQDCIANVASIWRDVQAAANENYRPGKFTSFIGYEYSPTLQATGMLHRNVLFRSAKVPERVFSAFDGFPEDMLRWLDASCKGECQALSIPHNPNWSWGLMFGENNGDASPLTQENLQLRARMETLIEIFQIKGNSECAPGLGNNDEQCGFEQMWPVCKPGELAVDQGTGLHAVRCVAAHDMVRNVLRKGLQEEARRGFNPYKFGFVAGTDSHNGTPGDTVEATYKGHGSKADQDARIRLGLDSNLVTRSLGFESARLNPGGLTGVWAEENTREAIFDAMKRKESFATSGTRLRVRLFGGFDFKPDLHRQPDMLQQAYASGVPMGGDLRAPGPGRSLTLLVWAMRDANSAPLQRLQVVKGWLENGETREQVYDVACADGSAPDPRSHQCRPDGATVDRATCAVAADKGAAQLATTWRDPAFDPAQAAFYYVRVLENPSCRYTQYDANRLGIALPAGVQGVTQERAWSSPIWYSPAKGALR